ncbi:hypothetical protein ACLIYP_27100, partial [Streptomyces nanhaiensis]
MNHATHGRATRRTGATALVAAVLGGLLGGAPAAHSAPPQDRTAEEPARQAAGPDDRVRLEGAPGVWPRPQSLRTRGPSVPVGREVLLVADEGADPYALDTVRDVLRAAGAREEPLLPGVQAAVGAALVCQRAGGVGGRV